MITLHKLSEKFSAHIIVAKAPSDKNNFGLLPNELDFAKKRLKKDLDYCFINRYEEQLFIVLEPKRWTADLFEKLRKLGASLGNDLNNLKIESVSLEGYAPAELALAEGIALANYQFLKYFSDKSAKKTLTTIGLVNSKKKEIEHLIGLVSNVYFARDLVNEPVSFLTAVEMANQFEKKALELGVKIEVLDQLKIETLKMGGLLSVNKGSLDPATFTILEWKPKKYRNKKPIILVGKGVVYDTGGLSLKPTPNSMDIMKCDMGGAAAVAGALFTAAQNNMDLHLIALIPATDNRPGGNAVAPGDIVTMFDKTTVEVLNTDAEGRMLLADALSYAKKYKPELVIDMATLTGAALRSVGSGVTAVMGTAQKEIMDKMMEAGFATYERLIAFPLWSEYGEEMKSKIADLKNIGGPYAGMITAGKFLEHFTDYPWIHCDIAGPAWNDSSNGYLSAGGSAVGVRLLNEFLKNY